MRKENKKRAAYALPAVRQFAATTGLSLKHDGMDTAISDLLANLMHLCDLRKLNFNSLLDKGQWDYDCEQKEEGEMGDNVRRREWVLGAGQYPGCCTTGEDTALTLLRDAKPCCLELLEIIARMKTEQEFIDEGGELADDDSINALDELIASARKITGITGPETEPVTDEERSNGPKKGGDS